MIRFFFAETDLSRKREFRNNVTKGGASTKILTLPPMVLLGVPSKDSQMAEREKAGHEARCVKFLVTKLILEMSCVCVCANQWSFTNMYIYV